MEKYDKPFGWLLGSISLFVMAYLFRFFSNITGDKEPIMISNFLFFMGFFALIGGFVIGFILIFIINLKEKHKGVDIHSA